MDEHEREAWDRFAAHAVAGILAGRPLGFEVPEQQIANRAAVIADALLEERRERSQ